MKPAVAVIGLLLAFVVMLGSGCALVTVPVKVAGSVVQAPFEIVDDDDDDD